jgi:hypothetical protein
MDNTERNSVVPVYWYWPTDRLANNMNPITSKLLQTENEKNSDLASYYLEILSHTL